MIIKGVPWDEKSSFRRGCAAAPELIWKAFLSPASNRCAENGIDLGREHFHFDGNMTLSSGEAVLREIELQARELADSGEVPIFLGGDHAVTFPLVRAMAANHPPLSVLHFDAHPDLYDHLDGDTYSHACPFARLWEERLIRKHVAVGVRTLNPHQRDQAEKFGSEIISMKDLGRAPTLSFSGPLYLSLDLDVLDPAFAPGVSHHEPGGMSTRELLGLLQGIEGEIVGADIVEYNPGRDIDGVTAMVAAKLLKEIASKILSR